MKGKKAKSALMCYDLLLAIGAIYTGIIMISGKLGKYPSEWLTKVPFKSWVLPGVLAIILYGIGNIIAAILSLHMSNKGLIASFIMGTIFLISLLASIGILGDVYLATAEFIILSIIQILLTLFTLRISSISKSKKKGIISSGKVL